jgi:hypothetical protein
MKGKTHKLQKKLKFSKSPAKPGTCCPNNNCVIVISDVSINVKPAVASPKMSELRITGNGVK